MSRVQLYRCKMLAEIPEGPFEELLARNVGNRAMVALGETLSRGGSYSPEVERCPHCGEVLRVRRHIDERVADAIEVWLAKTRKEDPASQAGVTVTSPIGDDVTLRS